MPAPAQVFVGTIWADQDRRSDGRLATVLSLDATHATCRSKGKAGYRIVRIRLARFGYAWKRCGFDSNVAQAFQATGMIW